jgi:multisubunit Na+/H+ antiporter MnhB subunit
VIRSGRSLRALGALASVALGALLVFAVVSLPPPHAELANAVEQATDRAGVRHEVTAVLLGFRGWDTCLEIAVLLLAVVGITGSGEPRKVDGVESESAVELPLTWLVRIVVPALILGAGHLLLLGASAPGGAFQAGSLLAAAAVLLIFGGHRPHRRVPDTLLRSLWIAGVGAFLLAGALSLFGGRLLLELPAETAGVWMLGIEAGVTAAIATGLASLFVAARAAEGAT